MINKQIKLLERQKSKLMVLFLERHSAKDCKKFQVFCNTTVLCDSFMFADQHPNRRKHFYQIKASVQELTSIQVQTIHSRDSHLPIFQSYTDTTFLQSKTERISSLNKRKSGLCREE